MFFKTTEPTPPTLDTYEQLKTLVTETLLFECPEHNTRHHLLYTTNNALEEYAALRDFYRQQMNHTTNIGKLSMKLYEINKKKYNQLYLLIRAYMHLADHTQRLHFNHHFSLSNTIIANLYLHYEQYKKRPGDKALNTSFWQAMKDDLVPLLTQLE